MRMKIDKPTDMMKKIAKALFSYNGRKYKVSIGEKVHLQEYWDGGTRTKTYCVRLSDMTACIADRSLANPFIQSTHEFAMIEVPEGCMIVQESIFCGKNTGITFYLRSDSDCEAHRVDFDRARLYLPIHSLDRAS